MDTRIFAIGVLLLLALGCAQLPSNGNGTTQPLAGNAFELGKIFGIKDNSTYTNAEKDLKLEVLEFTNSRCPTGVQCIWAGELGVSLRFSTYGKYATGETSKEIHLSETTKTKDSFLGYDIELVSIDFEKKVTQLKITASEPQQNVEKVWFSYDPKQCGTNPWDEAQWPVKCSGNVKCVFRDEEDRARSWLGVEHGIETYGYALKRVSGVVCMACSCPRGDMIAVLVDSKDSAKIAMSGWAKIGKENAIACTMDAKICADGSAMGRTAPFCEFAACPAVDLNVSFSAAFSHYTVPFGSAF